MSEGASLGRRLRALRAAAGLTQQQLAEAVGMSRSSISNIEAGRQDVLLHTLALLAAALGVSTAKLLQDQSDDGLSGPLLVQLAALLQQTGDLLERTEQALYELRKQYAFTGEQARQLSPRASDPAAPHLDAAMGGVYLYGRWRDLTAKMTTDQREAAADAVDRWGQANDEAFPLRAHRWWRS